MEKEKKTLEKRKREKAMSKHFVGMAGLHGYLPSYLTVGETRTSVAEDLAQIHELSDYKMRQLRKDWYLELDLNKDGNEYCEISECDCGLSFEECVESLP